MSNQELLAIYLRDHHAGATGAVQLLERIQKDNKGNQFAEHAEAIASEINHDKRILEEVMAAVDVTPSKTKDAGAWLSEKLGRLKLNGRIVEHSPLSRVVGFEALGLGIAGKIRLWHSLQIARQSDERLSGFDFDEMLERANAQRQQVHALHQQACEIAFVEAGGS